MTGYRHFPAYQELCETAEKAGLQVRLPVTTDRLQFAQRRGEEYRKITCIELWLPGSTRGDSCVQRAAIFNDDLEAAAQDLLARAA